MISMERDKEDDTTEDWMSMVEDEPVQLIQFG
jgi:hypothetical protein